MPDVNGGLTDSGGNGSHASSTASGLTAFPFQIGTGIQVAAG
jgi:hypothetical protein